MLKVAKGQICRRVQVTMQVDVSPSKKSLHCSPFDLSNVSQCMWTIRAKEGFLIIVLTVMVISCEKYLPCYVSIMITSIAVC